MAILQHFDAALKQFREILKQGSLPVRRPATQDPTFFGLPINQYQIQPLASAAVWSNLLTLNPIDGYTATLQSIVATAFNSNNAALIQFRLVKSGQIVPNFQFATGAEYNKSALNGGFPAQGRQTVLVLQRSETLILQAMNTGGSSQLILAGFNGFFSDTPDSASQGQAAGIEDA